MKPAWLVVLAFPGLVAWGLMPVQTIFLNSTKEPVTLRVQGHPEQCGLVEGNLRVSNKAPVARFRADGADSTISPSYRFDAQRCAAEVVVEPGYAAVVASSGCGPKKRYTQGSRPTFTMLSVTSSTSSVTWTGWHTEKVFEHKKDFCLYEYTDPRLP